MKKLLMCCVCLGFTGCAVTKFALPGGGKFSRYSVGTDVGVQLIEIGTNGTATVKGIMSKQAQTAAMVTEAAVTAAIKGAKGTP